jgi:hypothetical protein
MEQLKINMNKLYFKNLEIYAKKNKIDIKLPKLDSTYSDNNITITDNFTESNNDNNDDNNNDYSEDYIYKKPWNKLNIIHKKIKLIEFVNNMDLEDDQIKKHLKNQLVDLLKNKKLTKKSEVDYDSVNGRINSIPSLKITKNFSINA